MGLAGHEASLRGELRFEEPLGRHTSWGVGGPARRFYRPRDLADLTVFLRNLPPGEPVLWLGLGSNVLVRDQGVRATVIAAQAGLARIEAIGGTGVRAEVGVTCAKAARYCARRGLSGLEFLAGIPGTIGGALAMNAGCYGSETWAWVECVETLDRSGSRRVRAPADYRISYRSLQGPADEWFAAAQFRLDAGEPESGMQRIRELLARRKAAQPTDGRSCGSVFRNPGEGQYAARLIEAAGLKGLRFGGARVSEKHANFIVNVGGATAADIEALMGLVADRVERLHGIRLIPEVKVVGDA
jgi:UDP-N-acetylmuramate dehydrogenase